MSDNVTITVSREDLQRFISNLNTIKKELQSGPQPFRTHEQLSNVVDVILDVIPDDVFRAPQVSVRPSAPAPLPPATPAVAAMTPVTTGPAPAGGGGISLGRRGPASVPPPAPIEAPSSNHYAAGVPGAGGGVQVVEGREVTAEDAMAALQKVMPGATIAPPTGLGQAIARAAEHPLPNAAPPATP